MKSMRITAASILCLGVVLGRAACAAERLVWFGTYTNATTRSEGIYVARFDDDRGTLTASVLAAPARNPSFLAHHPRLPILFAVAEAAGADGKPGGMVAAFTIDGATGALASRGAEATGGAGPCHVAVDPDGTVVLAANYGGGSVTCLGLDAGGDLQPARTGTPGGVLRHARSGAGPPGSDPRRQERALAHSVDVASGGRFVLACDLGLDQVLVHALDRARATLAPHAAVTVKAGAGPRHLAVHPDGRRAWCVNELDLTVTGFTYDPQAGTLAATDTVSTLPAGTADRTGFSCAEIAVHPDGKFVYASNRGHDSIAMFRIVGDSTRLEFLGAEPTRARTPRHFAIAPGGRFMLVGGQASNTVAVFTIDPETGRLGCTDRSIGVPAPVCILFATQPLASTSSR